jgi:hypothetical protein
MKKIIFLIIILCLGGSIAFGQEETSQLAYRFLDGYITKKEAEAADKTGAIGMMVAGGLITGGGVAFWIWGDEMVESCSTDEEYYYDDTTHTIVSASIVGGGVLTLGIGTCMLLAKPFDYRAEYAYIFQEPDPVVQEALAVAVLHDLAEEGRNSRISTGIVNLIAPLITIGVHVGYNIYSEKMWDEDLTYTIVGQSFNLVNGIAQLFFVKSEEERVYEKYLIAKEAMISKTENYSKEFAKK